jgi:hypothetical protein
MKMLAALSGGGRLCLPICELQQRIILFVPASCLCAFVVFFLVRWPASLPTWLPAAPASPKRDAGYKASFLPNPPPPGVSITTTSPTPILTL